jgi:uncharacterized protein (DUF2252 family)
MDRDAVEVRTARGKQARSSAPRADHDGFDRAGDRPDPIALLEEQARTRVPDLVPIRYGRMMVSPFTFFRGAALVMASDLSRTAVSGITTQLCGDAHLSNFGFFASPERRLIFDINDFDETHQGPWEWDVKRLAASIAIAGRDNGHSKHDRSTVLGDTLRQYRRAMAQFARMRNLEVWYAGMEVEQLVGELGSLMNAKVMKRVQRGVDKAKTRDHLDAFSKLTTVVDGQIRFTSNPPLLVPMTDLLPDATIRENFEARIEGLLRAYRRTLQADRRHLLEEFRFVDVARKVVGVGSVGTRAWVVLLLGRDGLDPLILQAKEAERSVLERFTSKSPYPNNGQRVVTGQRLMQSASDIFLGWERIDGVDLRRRDWKESADVETMTPSTMSTYGRMCGWTLARAHARSGDRVAIGAYLGKADAFDKAVTRFAERYADQTERDHAELVEAVRTGCLEAEQGV